MLTILTPSSTELLTTLAAVKDALGIPTGTTTYDAKILALLPDVSAAIVAYVGRPLARATYLERLASDGGIFLTLGRRPIVLVASVLFRNDTAYTDYTIDAEAGMLYRELGWIDTQGYGSRLDRFYLPNQDRPDWYVTYRAGWLVPAQNLAAKTTIAAVIPSAGVYKFTSSANEFPALLSAGDRITVSGFVSPATANNATFTVTGTPTTGEVHVVEPVVAKVAGDQVSIIFANLPGFVHEAAVFAAVDLYRNGGRNSAVASKSVGSLSIAYGSSSQLGSVYGSAADILPSRSLGLLTSIRDVVVA